MAEFKLMEKLLYENEKSTVEGEFLISDETLWANQKVVADIFGTSTQNISKHFKNIVQEGELEEKEVSLNSKELFKDKSEFINSELINSKKGGRPQLWYNLDAILSIGYRINSKEATQFRRWSNTILKDYMIKGFVLDKELLKNGGRFTKDYFDKLLEEIREIRSSERRFNQKITDIYATSFDYNPKAEITREFFATVQNKLIYAVSKKTAAEIISERSDSDKPYMGLTSWNNAPNGKIIQSDVVIAKNYLNEKELQLLNVLVDGFLTLAENRAMRNIPTSMADWKDFLDSYITLNELPKLVDKGKISSKEAKKVAKREYEKFRVIQDKTFESDFDRMINEIKRIEGN
ncbi:MAG: virulence RhuM family protein [Methanobrevibacter woesei]|nr:virulence RhuM family protein [Methanobrevibacter woesei]